MIIVGFWDCTRERTWTKLTLQFCWRNRWLSGSFKL